VGFKGKRTDFQTVFRAAGETETTQGNIQDWLLLDEFQLVTEEEFFLIYVYTHTHTSIFFSFGATSTN
jgi:hypothetical protein